MSIGFIDSGIGGLTTLCECIKAYPEYDYIYIGDTLYAPYGKQTEKFLQYRATELTKMLVKMGAKLIIIACNTCSVSIKMRKMLGVPIVRVQPELKKVLSETTKKVLLIATPVTIESKIIKSINSDRLVKLSNKNLALLVENNISNISVLKPYLERILKPYAGFEGIILGCTHYIFLKDIISKILPNIKIYDSNKSVLKFIEGTEQSQNGERQFFITGKHDVDYKTLVERILCESKK